MQIQVDLSKNFRNPVGRIEFCHQNADGWSNTKKYQEITKSDTRFFVFGFNIN